MPFWMKLSAEHPCRIQFALSVINTVQSTKNKYQCCILCAASVLSKPLLRQKLKPHLFTSNTAASFAREEQEELYLCKTT